MEKDPVCQMFVDKNSSAAASTYNDRTYYFCSEACKAVFDKEPRAFDDMKYYFYPGGGAGLGTDKDQQAFIDSYNELSRSCCCH